MPNKYLSIQLRSGNSVWGHWTDHMIMQAKKIRGWTGKDGSPSPTLGTIIKKSYDGSSVLSTSLGSKTLNNTSSLGLRPSCMRPPARTFHTPVGTLRLFFQANLILIIILIDPV